MASHGETDHPPTPCICRPQPAQADVYHRGCQSRSLFCAQQLEYSVRVSSLSASCCCLRAPSSVTFLPSSFLFFFTEFLPSVRACFCFSLSFLGRRVRGVRRAGVGWEGGLGALGGAAGEAQGPPGDAARAEAGEGGRDDRPRGGLSEALPGAGAAGGEPPSEQGVRARFCVLCVRVPVMNECVGRFP